MTFNDIKQAIKTGDMSAKTAKLKARELPDFDEAMIEEISAIHDATMQAAYDHQGRMERAYKRGF